MFFMINIKALVLYRINFKVRKACYMKLISITIKRIIKGFIMKKNVKKIAFFIAVAMASHISVLYSSDQKTIPTSDNHSGNQIVTKKVDSKKQARLLEGKRLYDQVCFECHSTGFNGAPRLGNQEDWKEIRNYGLVALLESVIIGKGLMPRQGGSAEGSESRYRLMVEYMLSTVDAEDIKTTQKTWDESKLARHLSNGKALYNMVCSDCHSTGANGAPKISDKSAWEPRVKKGLDPLVNNVINGHGTMIPLGGSAIRSIEGVREMVAYMLTTLGYGPQK